MVEAHVTRPGTRSSNLIGNLVMSAELVYATTKMSVVASSFSKQRRILQIVCAIVYNLLGAGIIFGFAAFKPVL